MCPVPRVLQGGKHTTMLLRNKNLKASRLHLLDAQLRGLQLMAAQGYCVLCLHQWPAPQQRAPA